jgi:hypothetical protein
MANPDLSTLTTSFLELGGPIFGKQVLNWDLRKAGVQVRTNVNKPQAMTKLSAVGGPRPYRSQDDTSGNGTAFSDRVLTAYQSKWDYDFDPENARNTYLADAPEANFAEYSNQQVAKEYLNALIQSTLWLGEYNASGTTAAALATGWGKIIADAITATTLTANSSVGAITNTNAIDAFEAMVEESDVWLREQGGIIYCSYATFDKYTKHYRSLNSFGFQPSVTGDYKMDNKNVVIRPVSFIPNTSQRLVYTVPNNLVFGTDLEQVQVSATMRRNIIEVRNMMPVGCQIQDLGALFVNDQA